MHSKSQLFIMTEYTVFNKESFNRKTNFLIILAIGIYLIPIGIKYAAGGAAAFQMNAPEWGSMSKWILALIVIVVALGFKFYARGILSSASVLIGLIAGYVVAIFMGVVNFDAVTNASWFALPVPFKYGFEIK